MTVVHDPPSAQPTMWGSTPIPDPTLLSTAAIKQAVETVTTYIDGKVDVLIARLDGDEKAAALRLHALEEVPGRIREEVSHLETLHDQKFAQVAATFEERDKLAKRESDLNKVALDAAFKAQQEAVAAALKAQQEAAARQDEANQKAIDKSEVATSKTIDTNQTLASTRISALEKALDEAKSRITVLESVKVGNLEQRSEGRQSNAAIWAALGGITGLILFVLVVGAVIVEANR